MESRDKTQIKEEPEENFDIEQFEELVHFLYGNDSNKKSNIRSFKSLMNGIVSASHSFRWEISRISQDVRGVFVVI